MESIITFIDVIFSLLSLAILVRIVMSWIRTDPSSIIFRFFDDITRPILELAKRITPSTGMFDFSPMIALIGLEIIRTVLITILTNL